MLKYEFFLSGQNYYEVMWYKAGGNAYYTLAIQYVAAILNDYANAEVPANVAQMISEAEVLFNTYTPNDIKGLRGNNPVRKNFIRIASGLDEYNNGNLGVPHCD